MSQTKTDTLRKHPRTHISVCNIALQLLHTLLLLLQTAVGRTQLLAQQHVLPGQNSRTTCSKPKHHVTEAISLSNACKNTARAYFRVVCFGSLQLALQLINALHGQQQQQCVCNVLSFIA